jgi:hypothetical protein
MLPINKKVYNLQVVHIILHWRRTSAGCTSALSASRGYPHAISVVEPPLNTCCLSRWLYAELSSCLPTCPVRHWLHVVCVVWITLRRPLCRLRRWPWPWPCVDSGMSCPRSRHLHAHSGISSPPPVVYISSSSSSWRHRQPHLVFCPCVRLTDFDVVTYNKRGYKGDNEHHCREEFMHGDGKKTNWTCTLHVIGGIQRQVLAIWA